MDQNRGLQAVEHVAHDVWLLEQASTVLQLRIAWTAWYPLARNVVEFLLDKGGSGDIRANDYFAGHPAEAHAWERARTGRLQAAPPELKRVIADASQAAAHLSWRRVAQPQVQPPSSSVTAVLLGLWGDFLATVPEPFRGAFRSEWARLNGVGVVPQGGPGPTHGHVAQSTGGGSCTVTDAGQPTVNEVEEVKQRAASAAQDRRAEAASRRRHGS